MSDELLLLIAEKYSTVGLQSLLRGVKTPKSLWLVSTEALHIQLSSIPNIPYPSYEVTNVNQAGTWVKDVMP